MKLSEEEQLVFFENFYPLLHYAAVYSAIIPETSTFRDFFETTVSIKARSRDAIFNDKDLLTDYENDNAIFLSTHLAGFIKEVKKAIFSDFIMLRQGQKFGVFMDTKTGLFYHASGITDPFIAIFKFIPGYCRTALFNFCNKIVWDGLAVQKDRPVDPAFAQTLLQQYEAALKAKKVIELL